MINERDVEYLVDGAKSELWRLVKTAAVVIAGIFLFGKFDLNAWWLVVVIAVAAAVAAE